MNHWKIVPTLLLLGVFINVLGINAKHIERLSTNKVIAYFVGTPLLLIGAIVAMLLIEILEKL